jgi:hypothetical protein
VCALVVQAEGLIDVYVSSDPKLRGFGAAAVVRAPPRLKYIHIPIKI